MHSTINGIDLLFAVIGLALLLFVWIATAKYLEWEEEDQWKRRARTRQRYEITLAAEEARYRHHIRYVLSVTMLIYSLGYMNGAVKAATNSMSTLSEKFRAFDLPVPDVKHGGFNLDIFDER